MPPTALLLTNPGSRRGTEDTPQIEASLHGRFNVLHDPDCGPAAFAEAIRQKAHALDLVIIAGGDGSLNAALPALIDTGTPLGVLPMGTANDAARTLGIPLDLEDAIAALTSRPPRRVDVASINGVYFLNAASIGLSVDITARLTARSKKLWGPLAYVVAGLKTMFETRAFTATLGEGEGEVALRTVQLLIGNGRYYGPGLSVHAEATMTDGLLHVYSLGLGHWYTLLSLAPALFRGPRHHDHWSVHTCTASVLRIRTSRPLPVNTDGEVTTQTPAEVRVHPGALEVWGAA